MTSYQGPSQIVTTSESRTAEGVIVHGKQDFEPMRVAGRLAAETLDFITPHVVPGVTTEALDALCAEFIRDRGAISAPLNDRGFPKSICTSVNHVVCHGIPGDKKLKAGDAINIDITVIKDGFHGDTSRMYFAGKPSIQAKRLSDITFESMWLVIQELAPGKHLGDIGAAVQRNVEKNRFRWCASIAAMELVRCFTKSRRSCITVNVARGLSYVKA